jgi:hypothetical protein
MYGIIYSPSKECLFPLPRLKCYGIPEIFKTTSEAYDYIKEHKLREAEVRDIKTVMKRVVLLTEFYSGRIKVEKDENGELKITLKDKSKATYKELAPIFLKNYKKEREKKKCTK